MSSALLYVLLIPFGGGSIAIADEVRRRWPKAFWQFVKYGIISVAELSVSWVIYQRLPLPGFWAFAVALSIVGFIGFALKKRWAFRA